MKPQSLLVVAAAIPAIAFAQIQIVNSGATAGQVNLAETYVQNFDTLMNTGSGRFPITIPGWHGGDYGINRSFANGSFGTTGSTERALGGGSWAVSFANLSSSEINFATITYDGEQWFRGANTPQVLDYMFFNYKIFESGTGTLQGLEGVVGWTQVEALYFTSPNASLTTGATLNGNLPENTVRISASIDGIHLAPGQELWLRWYTADNIYNDHALATDNVRVSFATVPEPSACALWFGSLGLLLAATRRRVRNNEP